MSKAAEHGVDLKVYEISRGQSACVNPDAYLRKLEEKGSPNEFIDGLDDMVHHQQWKKVTLEDGSRRTKIVGVDIDRQKFVEIFHKQTGQFKEHVHRVKQQCVAIKELKDNLPQGHILA